MYDPATGRWTSEDPMGFAAGDANLARHVGNHATGATDPSGYQGAATAYNDTPPDIVQNNAGNANWLERQWGGFRDWWLDNGVGTRIEGGLKLAVGYQIVATGVAVGTVGTILGSSWGRQHRWSVADCS